MNPVDVGNPYQAPESSIAAFRAEIRRPPVYTAIALFCWVACIPCILVGSGLVVILVLPVVHFGWQSLFAGNGPRMMLIAALCLLTSILYIGAGRLVWAQRGSPGLTLCSAAVVMTYLAIWLLTWIF